MLEQIEKILAEEWTPIDIDALAKRVEADPHTAAFRLTLDAAIRRHFDATGRQYRQRRGRLVVCTAVELAKLSRSNVRTAVRKERRAIARAAAVRLAELPEEQRDGHRRFLERRSRMLALRELASRYQDPLEAIGKIAGANAHKALEERAMRLDSMRLLSEAAARGSGG